MLAMFSVRLVNRAIWKCCCWTRPHLSNEFITVRISQNFIDVHVRASLRMSPSIATLFGYWLWKVESDWRCEGRGMRAGVSHRLENENGSFVVLLLSCTSLMVLGLAVANFRLDNRLLSMRSV